MITKEILPSSPIGVQWEFKPRSAALSDEKIRATTVDVWSLPLEAIMSYGGAVSEFVADVSARAPIAFRSGEPGAGDPNRWDLVHRSQMGETFNSLLPAYVVFEAVKLTASQLQGFEKEIYKETDATVALPVGSGMIYLKELLLHTRLQLSLDLDQLPAAADERTRLFDIIFKNNLRVSEIRMQPTTENLSLWQNLIFDYSCSAAAILKWDESQTSWAQIIGGLASAQAWRSGVQSDTKILSSKNSTLSALEQAFADVFPLLRAKIPKKTLEEIWIDFLAALGEDPSREWESYSQLRLWPMFLKMHASETPEWVELAQLEWARFSAEFHPADETSERAKLQGDEIKINPSLQTVRATKDLVAIVRVRHLGKSELLEIKLDWMQAALIDESSEAPKMNQLGLLAHVTGLKAPQGGRPTESEWREKLRKLIDDGVLLASPI